MKPVIKKLLEVGIIDKDTALSMEKWRLLDPGSADLVGTRKLGSKKERRAFAEELEELLDEEREAAPKETVFEVNASQPFLMETAFDQKFAAVWDPMHRIICDPGLVIEVNDNLYHPKEEKWYRVLKVDKIHSGATSALQVEVEEGYFEG